MKIIFCDANIVIGMYLRYVLLGNKLPKSILRVLFSSSSIDGYISTYILDEMYTVLYRTDQTVSKHKIREFIEYMNHSVLQSGFVEGYISTYVHDIFDYQILQDAIDIKADILLTRNLKDFSIDEIYRDFGCKVLNRLDI